MTAAAQYRRAKWLGWLHRAAPVAVPMLGVGMALLMWGIVR